MLNIFARIILYAYLVLYMITKRRSMMTQLEALAIENQVEQEDENLDQILGNWPEKLDEILSTDNVCVSVAVEQLDEIISHIQAREQHIDPFVAAAYRYIKTVLVQKIELPF